MAQAFMSAWYADFFTELPNAFWRAAMAPELSSAEVDFLERAAKLPSGSRVLDVPCGSGRHALELTRRGCHVVGLDVSAEAIEHARGVAVAENLDVDLRIGDMRSLPADVRVDAVVCMGNSFGYLEHDGTRRLLADFADLLVPGGTLVLDYGAVAESLLPHLTETRTLSAGGIEVDLHNEYDTPNARLLTTFTFRRGMQEHRGTAVQHVYTAAEVARLVAEAGFTDIDLYGDTDRAPFQLGSPRLLLVSRTSDRA